MCSNVCVGVTGQGHLLVCVSLLCLNVQNLLSVFWSSLNVFCLCVPYTVYQPDNIPYSFTLFSLQYINLPHYFHQMQACFHLLFPFVRPSLYQTVMKRNICVQRTFSGVGLRSVTLSDLHPDEDYSVQVRCSAQQNFWKWGDWSKPFSLKTSTTGKGFICAILAEILVK